VDRDRDRGPDRDRADERTDREAAPSAVLAATAETVDRRGRLPVTGLSILVLLAIAAGLLAAGRAVRHLSQRGG
jgi:hypothetical protein